MRIRSPKLKLKKCGYSECGKDFLPQRPLQQTCFNPVCARGFNNEKEIEKRFKAAQNNTTTLSLLEEVAKKIIQKWVRLRDESYPCISCGRTYTKQWDGGHYYKAELYSGVIFNEMNINKQCSECNGDNMHGNLIEYRKGLVKKYGEERVNDLDVLAIKTKQYKYTREELITIANKYKLKIKNGDFQPT